VILVATAGQEWRRDSHRLLCRHFCDIPSNSFFSISQRKGSYWGDVREDGSDECFLQLGEGLFGGTPRCRGYGAKCFKSGEELCVEGLDERTKGEGWSKVMPRNLGVGLNVSGSQSE